MAGLHASIVGIGEGARATSAALRRAGLTVYDWDLTSVFAHQRSLDVGTTTQPPSGPGTIVVQMNANELVQLVARVGSAPFRGKRCIGYWAWELETVPRAWRHAFRYVDEIWTPSDFTSAAVRRAAPKRVTVRTVHHPIKTPQGAARRTRFGFPETGAAVLAALDIRSGVARKNPYAVITAFEAATRDDPSQAFLVLKIGGIQGNETLFVDIARRTERLPNVRILTESLSEKERDELVLSADVIVSLHRSEGAGLLMAEAMLAGKAVVATGWSGNMDFMSADSARLTPFELIPVVDPQRLFTSGRWADPNVEVAGTLLRGLIQDAGARKRLGEAARRYASTVLDPDRLSSQMAQWVRGA
ncbi:glycosyltransferase [Caulobacter sp. BE254]|uniref:glycosyltransferase n=1 Tax=Caulobacter sp. BE254 TaxID=2817720 RepID=UPI00285D48E0|nr:glycosyltransferase [Caulobacter sp. BE254]MDR7118679.1 glycosyltransferase involved in cell wall biosynthesis [Caulobacter sp. BE254]